MGAAAAMPDYAGLRQYRRARSTGLLVGVYDGIAAGMDTEGGRWQTVCEPHSGICSHQTLGRARSFAAVPEEWCETCRDEYASRRDCPVCTTQLDRQEDGQYHCSRCGNEWHEDHFKAADR